MDIKDKIAIVTGASAGIGLAIAKELGKEGAKVVLAARSEEKLKKIQEEISDSTLIVTDMHSHEDIKNLISKTLEKYGGIDLLVNNAGQAVYGPLETVDIEQYKSIMDLNVYAVLDTMQQVIPIMRKQGSGTILNISSRVSKNYFQNLGAYASTKYALNAITLTARAELEKDGIVISVFHPKMTSTDFGKNAMGKRPAVYQSQDPAVRPGMEVDTPEQVAERVIQQIKSETPEEMM